MTPEEILAVEKNIVLTLKNIYDPEIPVNIYDLGLIYEINYDPSGTADIIMTLTAPNCPMADILLADINREVGKVDGVEKVNITLTFDPQWDKSMMSEEYVDDVLVVKWYVCAAVNLGNKHIANPKGIKSCLLLQSLFMGIYCSYGALCWGNLDVCVEILGG